MKIIYKNWSCIVPIFFSSKISPSLRGGPAQVAGVVKCVGCVDPFG